MDKNGKDSPMWNQNGPMAYCPKKKSKIITKKRNLQLGNNIIPLDFKLTL